jgi:hypothetical protein
VQALLEMRVLFEGGPYMRTYRIWQLFVEFSLCCGNKLLIAPKRVFISQFGGWKKKNQQITVEWQTEKLNNKVHLYLHLVVKTSKKLPLENRVGPVVLCERGGKIMMIMMVAVARYFDGSWLRVIQQLCRPNFDHLSSSSGHIEYHLP